MSRNPHRSKTPAPIVPDETLEEKMKTAAENPPAPAPTQALATQPDVRIETIKHPQGERQLARARNGKFVSRTEASAIVSTKKTQEFLEAIDPEMGHSRDEVIRNSIYEGVVKAAAIPKTLGNAVKGAEFLDRTSGREKVREEALSNKDHVQNQVKVVVVPGVVLMNPTVIDHDEELRKKKEKEAKGPSFIDAEFKTDPKK
jgi:hypothetical protein